MARQPDGMIAILLRQGARRHLLGDFYEGVRQLRCTRF